MTDKELAVLLPALTLEHRIERIIEKYIGGAVSAAYDGERTDAEASRHIAAYLTRKIRPWLQLGAEDHP